MSSAIATVAVVAKIAATTIRILFSLSRFDLNTPSYTAATTGAHIDGLIDVHGDTDQPHVTDLCSCASSLT
jgi:hypothetical protein